MKKNKFKSSTIIKFLLITYFFIGVFNNTSLAEEKANSTTINQISKSNFKNQAVLQMLNKITAKTKILNIDIGEELDTGKLKIKVHKCWKSLPYERPENKILVEITEQDKNSQNNVLFYGWMLSSSPSISNLEHPIYDILALNCTSSDENEQQ